MRIAARAATLALALAGCTDRDFYDDAPPPNSGGPEVSAVPHLTSAEVEIFLSGSTLTHRDDQRTWTVYVDPTGELRGIAETLGPNTALVRARGTWTVLGDGRVCREWTEGWDARDSGCAFVRREGDVYSFAPVEAPEADPLRRRREAGNPRGL